MRQARRLNKQMTTERVSGSLAAIMPKLSRAEEHIEALDMKVIEFLNTRPYRIVRNDEMDGAYEVLRVEIIRQPPDALAVLIGDALQNLRSTLDHLAFQLAIEARGRALTAEEEREVWFPVTDDPRWTHFDGFVRAGPGRRINPLFAGAQVEIHALQPCHRTNPPDDPLWIVNHLNNIDKHRRVLLGGSMVQSGSWGMAPLGEPLDDLKLTIGLLEDGAEMARVRWGGAPPGPEPDLTWHFLFSIAIAEQGPLAGLDTCAFLRYAASYIRSTVLPRLAPFLSA
jgi:hypothetical protein